MNSLLNSALTALQQKKYNEALTLLQEALSKNPNSAEIHNNIAICYYHLRDFDKALNHYAKAVNLKPDYTEAHFNLALLFIQQRNIDAAVKQLNNVIQLMPQQLYAHKLLGDLYLQQEKLSEAKAHYDFVLTHQSETTHEYFLDALNNLGVVYLKLNKIELASECFTKVLAINESHQNARNNLAALYLQHERYDNARAHYQLLLAHDPNNLEAHYNLGVALMAIGELSAAISHFQFVIDKNTNHLDSLINLAAIYVKLNHIDKSLALYRQVLALESTHPIAQYMQQALAQERSDYSASPSQYVKNLFDNYAGYYDKHMLDVLQYRVPSLIYQAVMSLKESPEKPWEILDLGCGTGLTADLFRQDANTLIGIDISSKMLAYAKKKNIYSDLIESDIQNYLENCKQYFDLIVAADVFVYLGALDQIFKSVRQHLSSNGLFAFSVEILKDKENKDYQLQKTARFAHHQNYIDRLIHQYQFQIKVQQEVVLRMQEDEAVMGNLFVLTAMTQRRKK